MTDSLFSPTFGTQTSTLAGREELLQNLLQGLHSIPGSKDRAVLLQGPRGSGKTVFLLALAKAARKESYVANDPAVVSPDMLEKILEGLAMEAESVLGTAGHAAYENDDAPVFHASINLRDIIESRKSFAQRLSELCSIIGGQGKGVLILVDASVSNPSALRQLMIAYQEMVSEGKNIAIIVAGLPDIISAMLHDPALGFLNRSKKEMLAPLETQASDRSCQETFTRHST